MSKDKIVALSKCKSLSSRLKSRKKKIVFTNGCFDIIHIGHVKYLERAKALGDVLIVGVNSDSSMKKIKGSKRPIMGQDDRAGIVAGLESVDYVAIFNETTPFKLIRSIRPDVLVKGADWKPRKIVGADFIGSYGGKTISIPLVKGKSTSLILHKIINKFK